MNATVFYAPTKRRRYFTRKAAVNAEARALIERKYPTEKPEPDVGYAGWHWSNDARLVAVHKRLVRRIALAALEAS